jgi:hypothetical protein
MSTVFNNISWPVKFFTSPEQKDHASLGLVSHHTVYFFFVFNSLVFRENISCTVKRRISLPKNYHISRTMRYHVSLSRNVSSDFNEGKEKKREIFLLVKFVQEVRRRAAVMFMLNRARLTLQ